MQELGALRIHAQGRQEVYEDLGQKRTTWPPTGEVH